MKFLTVNEFEGSVFVVAVIGTIVETLECIFIYMLCNIKPLIGVLVIALSLSSQQYNECGKRCFNIKASQFTRKCLHFLVYIGLFLFRISYKIKFKKINKNNQNVNETHF